MLAPLSRPSTQPVGNVLVLPYLKVLHSNRHFHGLLFINSTNQLSQKGKFIDYTETLYSMTTQFSSLHYVYFFDDVSGKTEWTTECSRQISGDPDWHQNSLDSSKMGDSRMSSLSSDTNDLTANIAP